MSDVASVHRAGAAWGWTAILALAVLLRPGAELAANALPESGIVDLPPVSGNPLFPGADPDYLFADGRLWVYPTGTTAFYAYSTADLKHWRRHGPLLSRQDISWIKDDGAPVRYLWAPGMFARDGKYYLFFSLGPQTPVPSRIGVAVAEHPGGRFIDSGQPLLTGGDGFEAIDAMVFEDPKTGATLLYAGGSAGATLRVYELDDTLTVLRRQVEVETPEYFTEGPFMHEQNGVYYLSYSHGRWRSAGYSVHYSTGPSPLGPWTYRGAILESDDRHLGPGHHAFLQHPGNDQWYILYHRWNHSAGRGILRGDQRQVCIEAVEYREDGTIRPVIMTDAAVAFPSLEGR